LVLVDLQEDFLRCPGLVPCRERVEEAAAELLGEWRSAGAPVVHVRTTIRRDPDNRMPHWRSEGRWMCVEGEPGHASPGGLGEIEGEGVCHKSGYSGLQDPSFIELLGPPEDAVVVVCGVHLHACVRSTLLDLHQCGWRNLVVAEEAVASYDPVHALATRDYLEERGIIFATNRELMDWLKADPSSASPVRVLEAGDEIESAVAAARQNQSTWHAMGLTRRLGILAELATRLEQDPEPWSRLISEDVGKPIAMARAEVSRSIALLRAVVHRVSTESSNEDGPEGHCRRVPRGVLAVITPWNNPLAIPVGKLAPALAHGNAVIWKPSPLAPILAERFAALLQSVGVPSGLVGLARGGSGVARRLMASRGVDGITLTGGEKAGFEARLAAARTGAALQLELGGNNAALVWEDANLADAARQIATGAFGFAGQRCTANRRVVVAASVRDQFLALLVEATRNLRWGVPSDPDVVVGPMINYAAVVRVAAQLRRAMAAGATCRMPHGESGIAPPADAPLLPWHPATLVLGALPDAEIVQEESFGPVLVVQVANDWEEALGLVNGVRQGLAAALFSSDASRWEKFRETAQAGILKWNRSTVEAGVDLPFPAWKESGGGPPEHGPGNAEFHTRWQSLYPSNINR
jgi:acyl-CoA reductase-like NAD-dependent aldehyde dehydrogenase/nicotinamidase-related amidase